MKNQPRPLKRFGQNYLVDKNISAKIAEEFDPQPNDIVVEIGPGTGSLTSLLFDKVEKYFAVEIDKRVIDDLKIKYPSIQLINDDFLNIDLKKISDIKFRVIGNIPYNITSPIIFKLIENRDIVKDTMLMVQLEVAKRIVSSRGTKDYGILSVLLNYFCDTRLCFKISPNVFYPKPNVESAIIHLKFKKRISDKDFDTFFIKTVKAAFGNRRKTLKNSLSNSIFADINFALLSEYTAKRAEELSIEDFVKLAGLIKGQFDG